MKFLFVIFVCIHLRGLESKALNKLDMSHTFNEQTLFWPAGQRNFSHEVFTSSSDTLDWYQGGQYMAGEHGGTHIDSPVHFARGAWALDEIPLDRLEGPAVVVDVTDKAAQDRDYAVTVVDLQQWEEEHGRIPSGAIVLMCSGWDKKWPNKKDVFGNDIDDTNNFHFPGFHGDAAAWLVANRDIVGVSVDTPSIDIGAITSAIVHTTLMKENIYGLENVRGACDIPASGATVTVNPMKIQGASGGPARIIATWGDPDSCSSAATTQTLLSVCLLLLMLSINCII